MSIYLSPLTWETSQAWKSGTLICGESLISVQPSSLLSLATVFTILFSHDIKSQSPLPSLHDPSFCPVGGAEQKTKQSRTQSDESPIHRLIHFPNPIQSKKPTPIRSHLKNNKSSSGVLLYLPLRLLRKKSPRPGKKSWVRRF